MGYYVSNQTADFSAQRKEFQYETNNKQYLTTQRVGMQHKQDSEATTRL
jgi:hypothetical protein